MEKADNAVTYAHGVEKARAAVPVLGYLSVAVFMRNFDSGNKLFEAQHFSVKLLRLFRAFGYKLRQNRHTRNQPQALCLPR